MIERDLNIYSNTFDGLLYHYQDYNQNEVDAVIELQDGSFALIEIKLGAKEIDAAAANLLKVNEYFKEDGVIVVPITALKN